MYVNKIVDQEGVLLLMLLFECLNVLMIEKVERQKEEKVNDEKFKYCLVTNYIIIAVWYKKMPF